MEKSNNEEIIYAGFWIRLSAILVDYLILIPIIYIPLYYIYGMEYFTDTEGPIIKGTWDILLAYILPLVAAVIFWHFRAATPGKMLFKLKVIDQNTMSNLSIPKSIALYICYYISLIPLGLGFLWIVFDKKKQGFHNKITNTIVIKSK